MAARQNRVASAFFSVASHAAEPPPPRPRMAPLVEFGAVLGVSASPSIRRVFLRSFCARRRHVSSLNLLRATSALRVAAPSGCLQQGDMRRLGRGASPRRPLSRVSPGAKRSRRRRAQCGVQMLRDFVRTIISFCGTSSPRFAARLAVLSEALIFYTSRSSPSAFPSFPCV